MTPVDRYIHRGTMGTPRRRRLDTAAELSVHLNERVRERRKQGFSRDEAEHLAVQYMGPVEPANRRFRRHASSGGTVPLVLEPQSGGLVWIGRFERRGRQE